MVRFNIELSEKQAYKMVDAILGNNFFFAGCGYCGFFDLTRKQMVWLLQAAFSNNRKEMLAELYDVIQGYMREK